MEAVGPIYQNRSFHPYHIRPTIGPMNTSKRSPRNFLALALFSALALGACSGPGLAVRADQQNRTLASAPATSDLPGAAPAPSRPPRSKPAISEETLRDPSLRQAVMQRIIMQLVRTTRALPVDRYQREVRPRLARRLREAGFAPDDVDFILSDVDGSRPKQDLVGAGDGT
jgi:hypothetical protein